MKKLVLFIGALLASQFGFSQYNITKLGGLKVGNNGYANIWGYAQGNKEYALLGCTGTGPDTLSAACAIIDVTNPTAPNLLFTVLGPRSIWREIRTWGHYAYVTTEEASKTFGVTIVDLQYLPDSIVTKQYTANNLIGNVHALHIDDGYLYLYGSNNPQSFGGALIVSLQDPWNPNLVGAYSDKYVHDGIVRNNKMYSGEIFDGTFSIVDVTNKTAPFVINSQKTPFEFTHNTWLSTDNNYLFTTDEEEEAYVASYDVSNPLEIEEKDRYRRANHNGAIPHNTYILNDTLVTGTNTDWLTTSYYTEGVTIVDAHKPDNLVEVGHYDTSPLSGGSMSGAWGVYPYLPSGNLLVSDMQEGMFVLEPTYQRACYLEGVITDASTNTPISNATIKFVANGTLENSKVNGIYKTGIVTQGVNNVEFSAPGYITQTLQPNLIREQVVTLNVALQPSGVGIDNKAKDDYKVYPSIVKNELYIEQAESKDLHLKIIDINGKLVKDLAVDGKNITIDLKDINSGNYILQIYSQSDLKHSQKLIKE